MPSKEEIIKAIEILKKECGKYKYCENCLYDNDIGCLLNQPYEINLKWIKGRIK